MKEMILSAPGFVEMTVDEAFNVEGGVDWGQVCKGLLILAGAVIAVGLNPPAAIPLIVKAAIVFTGAYGAYQVVDGLLGP